ncbi:hypothetical protein KA013_01525 [Patescibacteria group bacterium]|nr:hypothetical protein [Patescibacteria group bacterium]
MSETIDLQPVIEKLSKSEKKQEQTLGTELLVLQTTLKEGEDAEKAQALLDTKAKLDAFESTISTDNPMPELQTLIDKAQSDITILEAQQAAEEKAVTDETAGETKGLRDRLTTSSDPEKEFTSWWKGIGTSILSVLGI